MPLSEPRERLEVHRRVIDMRAFERRDGMFEVEAHLLDTKPFDFIRSGATEPVAAGTPFHDMWIRLVVDGQHVVRGIEAASDVTPWAVCKEAESALEVLVGEPLASGWSAKVKERLRGPAGCTHLAEMLIPLATTALQGIYGLRPLADRQADIGKLVDSCYAFDRSREVVERLAPMHFQPRPKA